MLNFGAGAPDELVLPPEVDELDVAGLYVVPTGALTLGVGTTKGLLGAVATFGALGAILGCGATTGLTVGFATVFAGAGFIGCGFCTTFCGCACG